MSTLDKLERKWRFLSKGNLMIILVGAMALGSVMNQIVPQIYYYLCFNPERILQGEIWRLVTFILFGGSSSEFFMILITCFIFISISKSLEQIIGTFRLNFFLIMGLLLCIVSGFLFYFVMPDDYRIFTMALTPYYLYAMLFVLFAMIYPDARFLFMFIIPIKGKYMTVLTLGLYAYDVVRYFANGYYGYGWLMVFMIAAALLTIVFFRLLGERQTRSSVVNMKAYKNMKQNFKEQKTEAKEPRHKCEICGRTELTNPELDFRYCTKCTGYHEYCSEHIYTHIHHTEGSGNA